jgi:hypothetical protein
MKKPDTAPKLCAFSSEKLPRQQKRAGKNLQLNRRKATGNTLPRHVADTATGCHDEIADNKSIHYIRRTPTPFFQEKKIEKKNRKNLVPNTPA